MKYSSRNRAEVLRERIAELVQEVSELPFSYHDLRSLVTCLLESNAILLATTKDIEQFMKNGALMGSLYSYKPEVFKNYSASEHQEIATHTVLSNDPISRKSVGGILAESSVSILRLLGLCMLEEVEEMNSIILRLRSSEPKRMFASVSVEYDFFLGYLASDSELIGRSIADLAGKGHSRRNRMFLSRDSISIPAICYYKLSLERGLLLDPPARRLSPSFISHDVLDCYSKPEFLRS